MSQDLKKYYPSLTYIEGDRIPNNHEVFYDDGKKFIIHKGELSDKDILLLKKIYSFKEQSAWKNYLLNDGNLVPSTDKYRVIHIKMDKINDQVDLWINTFSSFFAQIIDLFPINDYYFICVLKSEDLDNLELGDILQTLHEDLGISASLYTGESLSVSDELVESFHEDFKIFNEYGSSKRINEFKDIYINHYVVPALKDSSQMRYLRHKIKGLKDGVELVNVLWKCQGNITQASTELFLHRNTLNYRLDRFEEETGLSLRIMKDLQLAYFSIV